jgi:hypothetical protein
MRNAKARDHDSGAATAATGVVDLYAALKRSLEESKEPRPKQRAQRKSADNAEPFSGLPLSDFLRAITHHGGVFSHAYIVVFLWNVRTQRANEAGIDVASCKDDGRIAHGKDSPYTFSYRISFSDHQCQFAVLIFLVDLHWWHWRNSDLFSGVSTPRLVRPRGSFSDVLRYLLQRLFLTPGISPQHKIGEVPRM